MTAAFRLLYVFVVIEHRSGHPVHVSVTAHPTAAWTVQQLREDVGFEGPTLISSTAPEIRSIGFPFTSHLANPHFRIANARSPHRREEWYGVGAKSVLGGLHHEYYLAPAAA